jgi:hypothetical protein
MRRWRLVTIVVLAAAGAVAAVFASDLRSWRNTLRSDALAYTAAPGQPLRLTAPTILPAGVSGTFLSVERDRKLLDALRQFVIVYHFINPMDNLGPGVRRVLDRPEALLAKAAQDPDPARAAQAYDVLGALVFRSAYPGTGTNPTLLAEAVSDLQNAVRTDGTNEMARENLELALRVLVAKHGGEFKLPGSGTTPTKLRRGSNPPPPGGGF